LPYCKCRGNCSKDNPSSNQDEIPEDSEDDDSDIENADIDENIGAATTV